MSAKPKRRLDLYGPNSLERESRFGILLSFVRSFANPLILILMAAGAISLTVGDPVGELIIIAMVLLSVLLNFLMEFQARHAVHRLTGKNTELEEIAARLAVKPPYTEFGRGIRNFGMMIARVIMLLVLFVLLVNIILRSPLESSLFSVALAVGIDAGIDADDHAGARCSPHG